MMRQFFETDAQHETMIVPITVLPEVDYLVSRRMGTHVAASLMEHIATGELHVEQIMQADLLRSIELMRQYADNSIGFVDASIVAVAERLGIRKILTVDRRHFGQIRPLHAPALEILP